MRTLLTLLALVTCTAGLSLSDGAGIDLPPVQFVSVEGLGEAGEPLRLPGACCLVDGAASFFEQEDCLLYGGFWGGQASCDPNPCPQDLGG